MEAAKIAMTEIDNLKEHMTDYQYKVLSDAMMKYFELNRLVAGVTDHEGNAVTLTELVQDYQMAIQENDDSMRRLEHYLELLISAERRLEQSSNQIRTLQAKVRRMTAMTWRS